MSVELIPNAANSASPSHVPTAPARSAGSMGRTPSLLPEAIRWTIRETATLHARISAADDTLVALRRRLEGPTSASGAERTALEQELRNLREQLSTWHRDLVAIYRENDPLRVYPGA